MSTPRLSAIGDLVEPVSSWTPQRDAPGGVFTYIDLSAVAQDAKIVSGAREIACAEAPSRARQLVRVGDVLVSTVRPNLNAVARVPSEFDGATASTGFCVLRPRSMQLDGRYLYQWVKSPRFVSDMVRKATGASYPAVSDRIICESKIPLPPLSEQRRIAEILDKADALRAKRRVAIAQLDSFTQSIFLDMFGDPATILHKWPVSKLGERLDFLTSGSRGWAKHYSDRGDLFLRIQNVRRDELSLDDIAYVRAPDTAEARRTKVEAGDVLLSITADLGRTAVVPEGLGAAYINQHLAVLRTKSFVPRFLSAYLASPTGRSQVLRQNRQAVKAGLNFDDIRGFVVPFPPINNQRKFEAAATAVGTARRAQNKALAGLDALFASLQHRAFRGEL
jgi:type I restriction enzyme S subunit